MNAPVDRTAAVTLWPAQWATVIPPFREIEELLSRELLVWDERRRPRMTTVCKFDIRTRTVLAPDGRSVAFVERQFVPLGAVAGVINLLERKGIDCIVDERRADSPRWVLGTRIRVSYAASAALGALAAARTVRVVERAENEIAEGIAAACDAYPDARIAIGLPTRKTLERFMQRFAPRFREPLGFYLGKRRLPGRVSIGLIGQLPIKYEHSWDLLVLPHAESTVGDRALEVVQSAKFPRVLSFSRVYATGDVNVDERMSMLAEIVRPEPRPNPPVTAVILAAHGSTPGKWADAFEEKRQLYVGNAKRNRRIAEIGKGLANGRRKSAIAVLGDERTADLVRDAAAGGIAILVETPAHARTLAESLTGWVVRTASQRGDSPPVRPIAGCGYIVTELGAAATDLEVRVVIRATGTRWPMPDIGWPRPTAETGVLIDFSDEYHEVAARHARHRVEHYRRTCAAVWP